MVVVLNAWTKDSDIFIGSKSHVYVSFVLVVAWPFGLSQEPVNLLSTTHLSSHMRWDSPTDCGFHVYFWRPPWTSLKASISMNHWLEIESFLWNIQWALVLILWAQFRPTPGPSLHGLWIMALLVCCPKKVPLNIHPLKCMVAGLHFSIFIIVKKRKENYEFLFSIIVTTK